MWSTWVKALHDQGVAVSPSAEPTRVRGLPPERYEIAKAKHWRKEEERIVILAMLVVFLYVIALILAYWLAGFSLQGGQKLLVTLSESTGGIIASLAAVLSVIAVIEISRAVRAASDEQQRREQLLELFKMWEGDEYVRARAEAWRALETFCTMDGPQTLAIKNMREKSPAEYQSMFRVMAFFGLCRILIAEDKLDRRSFSERFGLMYIYWYYWAFQTVEDSDQRNTRLLHGLLLDVVEEEWICEGSSSDRWKSIALCGSYSPRWFDIVQRFLVVSILATLLYGTILRAPAESWAPYALLLGLGLVVLRVVRHARMPLSATIAMPIRVCKWLKQVKASGPGMRSRIHLLG